MTTPRIGHIVAASLLSSLVLAIVFVAGPIAGATEHVITGTILLTSAAGWAAVALLSMLFTAQPQHWALLPAAFLGAMGGNLLIVAPGDAVLSAMGWMWPPLMLVVIAVTVSGARSELHSRSRGWLVYPLLGLYALASVGGAYQTMREWHDRQSLHAPGDLVDIGGRRLHIVCAGTGSPTVLLESGLGGMAADWTWISQAVARDTQVCAYDRAGRGWSDEAASPQDGDDVATDLHLLLERRHIRTPVVFVGHSSGAPYVRIYAQRYPEQVAGVVLLDGQPAEAFERLPIFPAFHWAFRRVSALLPSLGRIGITGLSARYHRSVRDEFSSLLTTLREAQAATTLYARPLVVVTATRGALDGWLPLQDEMAALSSNSLHRVAPYEHSELVANQDASLVSVEAIRDVLTAVRTARPLATLVAAQ